VCAWLGEWLLGGLRRRPCCSFVPRDRSAHVCVVDVAVAALWCFNFGKSKKILAFLASIITIESLYPCYIYVDSIVIIC